MSTTLVEGDCEQRKYISQESQGYRRFVLAFLVVFADDHSPIAMPLLLGIGCFLFRRRGDGPAGAASVQLLFPDLMLLYPSW